MLKYHYLYSQPTPNFQITKTRPPRAGRSKSRDESHLSWISSQLLSKEPRTRGKGRGCDDSPSRFPALADQLINKLHTRSSHYRTGFLSLSRTDVWVWVMFVVGAVPCTVGCLLASTASTDQVLVATQVVTTRLSLDIAKHLLSDKFVTSKNIEAAS